MATRKYLRPWSIVDTEELKLLRELERLATDCIKSSGSEASAASRKLDERGTKIIDALKEIRK